MRATVCTVRKAGDLCVHARQYACVGVYTRTELARTHHPTPPTMSGTLYDCAVGVVSDAPKRPSRCVADLHRGPLWLQPPAILSVLQGFTGTDEMARRHLLLPVPVVVKFEDF